MARPGEVISRQCSVVSLRGSRSCRIETCFYSARSRRLMLGVPRLPPPCTPCVFPGCQRPRCPTDPDNRHTGQCALKGHRYVAKGASPWTDTAKTDQPRRGGRRPDLCRSTCRPAGAHESTRHESQGLAPLAKHLRPWPGDLQGCGWHSARRAAIVWNHGP